MPNTIDKEVTYPFRNDRMGFPVQKTISIDTPAQQVDLFVPKDSTRQAALYSMAILPDTNVTLTFRSGSDVIHVMNLLANQGYLDGVDLDPVLMTAPGEALSVQSDVNLTGAAFVVGEMNVGKGLA